MWSNQKTKRNGLVLLMAAALACASVAAAETRYHLISIPEGAYKVADALLARENVREDRAAQVIAQWPRRAGAVFASMDTF